MKKTEKRSSHAVVKWIALAVTFVALWLLVGLYFAFVYLVIALAVIRKLNSRIPYTIALILLLIAALFAALSYESAANLLVSIGFYAMAMGIILQFYGFVQGCKVGEEESLK